MKTNRKRKSPPEIKLRFEHDNVKLFEYIDSEAEVNKRTRQGQVMYMLARYADEARPR